MEYKQECENGTIIKEVNYDTLCLTTENLFQFPDK